VPAITLGGGSEEGSQQQKQRRTPGCCRRGGVNTNGSNGAGMGWQKGRTGKGDGTRRCTDATPNPRAATAHHGNRHDTQQALIAPLDTRRAAPRACMRPLPT
jgi:hypothetical protein